MSASPPPPRFTTHTPACDSCRFRKIRCDRKSPRCGNCRKSCIDCTFTNRARGNENEDRLGKLEKSLLQLTQAVEAGLLRSSAIAPPTPPSPGDQGPPQELSNASSPFNLVSPDHGALQDMGNSFGDIANFEGTRFRYNYVDFPQSFGPLMMSTSRSGQRVFHGSVSLAAQCFGIRDHLLNQFLSNPTPSASFMLDRSINQMSDVCKTLSWDQDDYDASYQGGLLQVPSRQQVEQCVEMYFAQTSFPGFIFHPKTIRARLTQFYSGHPSADPFLEFCLLYILLQTKPWLTLPPEYYSYEEHGNSSAHNPFHRFLTAARNTLYQGSSPRLHHFRLLDVQALIAMTLVAIECGDFAFAARNMHHACFIAKEMGLTFEENLTQGSDNEREEKQLVFRALYTLDKSLCLTLGRPSALPSCELVTPLPDAFLSYFDWNFVAAARASIELAQLQEQTFMRLFSAMSRSHDIIQRQECIQRLADQLEAWALTHSVHVGGSRRDSTVGNDAYAAQLSYAYHAFQVIIHSQSFLNSQSKILCHAQAALQLMVEEYSHEPQSRIPKALNACFLGDAVVVLFPILKQALSSVITDEPSPFTDLLTKVARRKEALSKPPEAHYPRTRMDQIIITLAQLPDGNANCAITDGRHNSEVWPTGVPNVSYANSPRLEQSISEDLQVMEDMTNYDFSQMTTSPWGMPEQQV